MPKSQLIYHVKSNLSDHQEMALHHDVVLQPVVPQMEELEPYQWPVELGNMGQYEQDKRALQFNKLCMIRIENAAVLITQQGQTDYFGHLKFLLQQLIDQGVNRTVGANLHFYAAQADTFLIACNRIVDRKSFMAYIYQLESCCHAAQNQHVRLPFLFRFVLVRNHVFLLERAYAVMESSRNSQNHVLTDEHFTDDDFQLEQNRGVDELACIQVMQYALTHDKVVPYYQGMYNNRTGKVDKYEALMRLCDSKGNIYNPGYFMETAKKYRLYLDLNLKMFHAVLRDFWDVDFQVGINLSVHDMLSPQFRREMAIALAEFPRPYNLTFELLEDECIANMAGVKDFIAEVRSYGVKIAVDDFGSGYSNLVEISKIRPDYIKIDGQIIRKLDERQENESILEAVSLLGQRLSIQLVAEYVENQAIQDRILAHQVFYSQGYHFSKPLPFAEIKEQLSHVDASGPCCSIRPPVTTSAEERDFFQAMQELTSDLLFRFDVHAGRMQYFGVVQKDLGIPPVIENFPQTVIQDHWLVEEDVPALLKSVANMEQGIEEPALFRLYHQNGQAYWYRMDYKIIKSKRKRSFQVIGKLTNIQSQRDMEERLNIDTLTGCLRKEAFETLAKDYLLQNPSGRGALFLVDLDNFKAVNDNLGHQFGDHVLRGVGEKLRSIFRKQDLVGRIGGDEFMILMEGCDQIALIQRKAKEILGALDETYHGTNHDYRVSASVGISRLCHDGNSFQMLYDHGDMALFDAKNRGKNDFVLYYDTLSKGTMENTLPYEVATRAMAQHYDVRALEGIFNLLFEAKELEISLQAVLELLGSQFEASRAYIFQQHPTLGGMYQNTYEWCNTGITREKSQLHQVPATIFQELFAQANDDGIFYCNDLSQLQQVEVQDIMVAQNIQSFLHIYITLAGNITYIIGMDECDYPRVWSPLEVGTILHASKIIAQFLHYKKALEDVETMTQVRLSALDTLGCYAYIIDRNTHQLTYFNARLKESLPFVSVGQSCYRALRGRNAPCADCPLLAMEETGATEVKGIVSGSMIGSHVLTMASLQPVLDGRHSACITAIPLDGFPEIRVEKMEACVATKKSHH